MSSMEAALFFRTLMDGRAHNACDAAQGTLRIRQAAALGVGGVFMRSGNLTLYRAHGEPEDVDSFLNILALSADDTGLIDRWKMPRRVMRRHRLRSALLVGDEADWLSRQLAAPAPDARLLRLFSLWVDLRETERDMGFDFNFAAASARENFPTSRLIEGLDVPFCKPD